MNDGTANCDDWTKIAMHCRECGVQFFRKVKGQRHCDEHRDLAGAVIRPQGDRTSEKVSFVGPSGKRSWKYTDEEYDRRWMERLRARTLVNERGCFIWQGPVGHKGYIMLPHRQWQNSGHRIAYRILRQKDLATSDLICHECDTRRCWNIDHLFIGTEAVNNRDCGNKGRHHNTLKTTCKRGHPYDEENTYWKPMPGGGKSRACKACNLIRIRVANGWTLEEAIALPKIPYGYRKESAL